MVSISSRVGCRGVCSHVVGGVRCALPSVGGPIGVVAVSEDVTYVRCWSRVQVHEGASSLVRTIGWPV